MRKTDCTLHHGDCLKVLPRLSANSVDLVLVDPPYGKTKLGWDCRIPLPPLWAELSRGCGGPVVIMAVQPFTTVVVNSNPGEFRYALVWDKGKGSNPLLANKRPMSSHEDVLVFYGRQPTYNPQMRAGAPYKAPRTGGNRTNSVVGNGRCRDCDGAGCTCCGGTGSVGADANWFRQKSRPEGGRFPLSVMRHSIHCGSKLHPSQKPVSLMEELVLTYTNPGAVVLDFAMGSGTTGVACVRTGRKFIGIEKDAKYFEIAKRRIKEAEHAS
jgi:hypothetical protein